MIYNASLGEDQLFEITQSYLDASSTLVVNVPWLAELNLYWLDANANQEIDPDEVATFAVGKPQISDSITMQLITTQLAPQ